MAGKLCDQGETFLANAALKSAAESANLYLGLYKVPTSEPAETALLTDLTEPAGVDGYARIALPAAGWTISGINPTVAEQPQKVFTAANAWGNVYGYFVTDDPSANAGNMIAAEQFSDAPYDVPANGVIKITPKLTWG